MDKTLVIENVPTELTSADVQDLLSPLGRISWVYLRVDPERNCQTAFVEMANEKDASRIIVKWNGAQWHNRVLRVKYVDANFDRVATISGNASAKALPVNTQGRIATNRLDVRDLIKLARNFRIEKEAQQRNINVSLTVPESSPRWPMIVLVMLILVAIGYAFYQYTHA